jgi:putative heme-binding domain-containing protein
VFATGLRNIYDVALDEDLNVFVRDNENDGGTYKIRVCHSFFGADHGYPHLYEERPDETLAPLADLGLGSSAGGLCYLECQFPATYRGNLFFCEWGRAVVRSEPRRLGASFAPLKEIEFASGATNDPYGFKPTDLVVDRDGALLVADWADGQRPRRGRGRIYRISHGDKSAAAKEIAAAADDLVGQLDSESYHARRNVQERLQRQEKDGLVAIEDTLGKHRLGVRGRLHAVWLLAKSPEATEKLIALARSDPEPRVRAQAVRALADIIDPVLVQHRLAASAGEAALAARIAHLAAAAPPCVQLEAIIALGRLSWRDAPAWLSKNLKNPDPALAHAAQWALRQSRNWPALLQLLDAPDSHPLRAPAMRAIAGQYEQEIVDGLIERLQRELEGVRRVRYADLLTRVHKKPGPWTYWGFRPGPRPANTRSWERTLAIEQALDRALGGNERLDVLHQMQREKVPARANTLGSWLESEPRAESVAAILTALSITPEGESRPHLVRVLQSRKQTQANRLQAVALFVRGLDERNAGLLAAAEAVEDGPILVELLRALAARKAATAARLLTAKLDSANSNVRASAVAALAELESPALEAALPKLLEDADAGVRAAAVLAAGKLSIRPSADRLVQLTHDPNVAVRRASFAALGRLRDPRALPAATDALADRTTVFAALEYLSELGGLEHTRALTDLIRREPASDTLAAVAKVLVGWLGKKKLAPAEYRALEQALAEIHGHSGMIAVWRIATNPPDRTTEPFKQLSSMPLGGQEEPSLAWSFVLSNGVDARVRLVPAKSGSAAWLGLSEIDVTESVAAEFFTASSGIETVCVNDKVVFQRARPLPAESHPDVFEAQLTKGRNRILVRLTDAKGAPEFQLRFRRKSARPDHERLTKVALSRVGNPERGRKVFMNAEKSLCSKCHRIGDQGERIGPELTGLGSRFSKVYIIESILEPSRAIAPSFESIAVVLKNGTLVTGVRIADTETTVTLVDNQAQKHVLARADIETQARHPLSTMPEGLERRLTEDEFVDLIAYLVKLKDNRGR